MTSGALAAARLRHRHAWYDLGLYQRDDPGTLIGRSLRVDVTLTFVTGQARRVISFAELDRRSVALPPRSCHADAPNVRRYQPPSTELSTRAIRYLSSQRSPSGTKMSR